jgi:hypothetical protein
VANRYTKKSAEYETRRSPRIHDVGIISPQISRRTTGATKHDANQEFYRVLSMDARLLRSKEDMMPRPKSDGFFQ